MTGKNFQRKQIMRKVIVNSILSEMKQSGFYISKEVECMVMKQANE